MSSSTTDNLEANPLNANIPEVAGISVPDQTNDLSLKPKSNNRIVFLSIGVIALVLIGLGIIWINSSGLLSNNLEKVNKENEVNNKIIEPTIIEGNLEVTTIPLASLSPTTLPNITSQPVVTSTVSNIVVLSKTFNTEVLPWAFTFKYPSNWTEQVNSKANGKLSATVKVGSACGSESICALTFIYGYPAEMLDTTISKKVSEENIVLQRDGTVKLARYMYLKDDREFFTIDGAKGFFIADIAPSKVNEALELFKQILGTYVWDEAGSAL